MNIRPATLADAPAIQAIYAPYVLETPATFEETPPSVADIEQRLHKIMPDLPWLCADEAGTVLGYAYAGPYHHRPGYRWSVEVSVYVERHQRGRGLGRTLYLELFDRLRRQGLYNVCARIALPNDASVALHERMGLRLVGVFRNIGYKFGRWHDVGSWQGELQPHAPDPVPPRPDQG